MLLEYVLLLGPEQCKGQCQNAIMTLRNLCRFNYYDGQREIGGGVRQIATRIVELLENPDEFAKAQRQAIEDGYVGKG